MTTAHWGDVAAPGGSHPSAVAMAAVDMLVAISSVTGESATAVGLQLEPAAARANRRWELPLADGARTFATRGTRAASTPSVLPDGDRVYLVGGTARAIADARTGQLITETVADKVASAGAALTEDTLVVPEIDRLTGYDRDTLELRWQRRPPHDWLMGQVRGAYCPVRDPGPSTFPERGSGLWQYLPDELRVIPGSFWISSGPVKVNDLLFIACGGGAGSRLLALDRATLEIRWQAEGGPQDRLLFAAPSSGPPAVDPAVIRYEDAVVWTNQSPAVELRDASTGALAWRTSLIENAADTLAVTLAQPTAVALVADIVWVSTHQRLLIGLDGASGEPRFTGQLGGDDRDGIGPVAILPAPDGKRAVAVNALGAIWAASPDSFSP